MTSIGYMFWAVGKILETIAIGSMGTSIVSVVRFKIKKLCSIYITFIMKILLFFRPIRLAPCIMSPNGN